MSKRTLRLGEIILSGVAILVALDLPVFGPETHAVAFGVDLLASLCVGWLTGYAILAVRGGEGRMSNEHTPQVISMTVRELAQAIQAELSAMLELRDELYYKRLGPNNENEDEFYDDAERVETWQVSNRIGGHIAAARRMAAAIERTGEASA